MLIGEQTDLRAVDRSDVEQIHAWLDDPELMSWWGNGAPAISIDQVRQRLEIWLDDERIFGHPMAFIVETLEREPIGLILLSELQPVDRSAELSFVLTAAHRERGLGSDALVTLVHAAFDQWGLHRLTARAEASNARAHRFFEKNGFRLEGRLREARFIDGEWSDIVIFGCVRAEGGSHE